MNPKNPKNGRSVVYLSHVVSITLQFIFRHDEPLATLPAENGPLIAPANPPRAVVLPLPRPRAKLRFERSSARRSVSRPFSRSIACLSSSSRSCLLRLPVNTGFTGAAFLPFPRALLLPRPPAGELDRDGGSVDLRLSRRCTGAGAVPDLDGGSEFIHRPVTAAEVHTKHWLQVS